MVAKFGRRRSCVLCRGPLGPRVNAMLAAGLSGNAIEAEMRRSGTPVKQETVRRHKRECMADDPASFVELEVLAQHVETGAVGTASIRRDVARIVQLRAIRQLQRGAIAVSTRDGLAAQAMLDRRAERAKDRQFLLNLARLLSGAGGGPPADLVGSEPSDARFRDAGNAEPGQF